MRMSTVAAVLVAIAAAGAVAYVVIEPHGRSPVARPTASEPSPAEQAAPRPERRPRSHAAEQPAVPVESPGSPTGPTQAWGDAVQSERRSARRLAPLLAERDATNQALREVGMLADDESLMARIDRAFTESVATVGEDRQRRLVVLDELTQELKDVVQQKFDVGVLAETDSKAIVGAVAALRSGERWYDSTLFAGASREPPAADVGEDTVATTPTAAGDRAAIAKRIRETRQTGLREEAAILDRLLAPEPSQAGRAERVGGQIRRLVVRVQLGEIDAADARRQADDLLSRARADLDATAQEDLRSLAGLLDWYGGAVMRKLYGD